MKKLLLLFVAILAIWSQAFAKESDDTPPSQPVGLEFHRFNNPGNGPHRAPFSLNISVFFDSDLNLLEVLSDDDISAEVFLYLNDVLINYSSQLNTSFQITNIQGLYKIVIMGDSWEAVGYLQF